MDDLARQPTRRRIVDYVTAHPGSSAREIQRGLGLGWGETAYHLLRLVRGGALRKESTGHRDFYFMPVLTLADRKIVQALHSPTERALLAKLLERTPLRAGDLQEGVGVGRSAVYFHLRHLVELTVVEDVYEEGDRLFRISQPDRVRGLLAVQQESWGDRLVDRFASSYAGLVTVVEPSPNETEQPNRGPR